MRVIAGELRRRKLLSPPGLATRPTPDRLRETLFAILQPEIEGVVFLDAYAGSGAVGIEALSRGARSAIFVEKHRDAVAVLRENLRALGLEARARVFTGKAAHVLSHATADVVFLDPPYELESEYDQALTVLAERPAALVIVQHSAKFDPGPAYGRLARSREVKQGNNALTFYRLP
jgi:16S rRNA (guanine966-N2)-methyltransferase